MFSGIGGFELGIKRAFDYKYESPKTSEGLQDKGRYRDINEQKLSFCYSDTTSLCVGYSEIDRYAIQIYEKHFGGHKNYGDATKIDPATLPEFDFLVGGFPCQSFSIAGKRRGFEDTRGTLFFEIARVLKEKQPRLFLLENVKGLLNHDGGKTFTTILKTIDELGYDAEWQVLNSKYFGVPQNRERVFIIGHLRGESGRQIFPIRENDSKIGEDIKRIAHNDTFRRYNQTYDISGSVESLDTSGGGGHQPCIEIPKIAGTLTGGGHSGGLHSDMTVIPVLTPDGLEKRQNGRRFKEDGEPMFTLTGQDIHGVMIDRLFTMGNAKPNRSCLGAGRTPECGNEQGSIRRLTPIECERLQGFPDNWTEGISDTQRYKCLGNAVTTNVIQAIMEKIINA